MGALPNRCTILPEVPDYHFKSIAKSMKTMTFWKSRVELVYLPM
jgi:hypothetical protein